MDRREFLQLFAKAIWVGFFATSCAVSGCEKKSAVEKGVLVINGVRYEIREGVVGRKAERKGGIKLGVMTDLHGSEDNSRYFASLLEKQGVEAYLLLGDLSDSRIESPHRSYDDDREIVGVIRPIAEKGKLVLVIPGNHEPKDKYFKALDELSSDYPNVIDMQRNPVAELGDVTIVALGGLDSKFECIPRGFLIGKSDYDRLGKLAQEHHSETPLLIATHGPKRYRSERGLDYEARINWGSEDLSKMRYAIGSRFAVSGHIHPAFGVVGPDETPLQQGKLYDALDFNPGAVYEWAKKPGLRPAAGILEFIGAKARARIFNR